MQKNKVEEKDVEQEAIISYVSKNDLMGTVANSLGVTELNRSEKRRFLGQLRERILKALTEKQMNEKWVYPDIIEAIKDVRSSKVVVKGNYAKKAKKYTEYAKKYNKRVVISNNPEYIGDVVLVVVADDAVDVNDIEVGEKTADYIAKGLPNEIIKAGSGKLCGEHYQKMIEAIGHEVVSFSKLSLFDRLVGEKCVACTIKESNNI
ncbi:DUF1694 domain-containing protein [Peptococcaceae bacterium 1198_IL3148]